MRLISFAYTSPPLVAGRKTCTRREWNDEYAARFKPDELLTAYDRSPRFHGNPLGVIRLIGRPRCEPMEYMPDSDYEAEGFGWLKAHPESWPKMHNGQPAAPVFQDSFSRLGFERWRTNGGTMWVVRFKLEYLTEIGQALRDKYTTTVPLAEATT